MAWAGSEAVQEAAVAPPAAPAHLPRDCSPGPGCCLHACLLCSSGQHCRSICSCSSFIQSDVQPYILSSIRLFVPILSSIHPPTLHLFICSFVPSFIHSFTHSFVRSFVRSFIHSFVHSFIQIFCAHLLHALPPMLMQSHLQPCMHLFSNCCRSRAEPAERLCCLACTS